MTSRLLRLAVVGTWLFACLTAFMACLSYESLVRFGGRWDVLVSATASPPGLSGEQLLGSLRRVSQQQHVTIVRVLNPSRASDGWRGLELRPDGSAVPATMPAFSRAYRIPMAAMTPASARGAVGRGYFLASGPAAGRGAFVAELRRLGLRPAYSDLTPGMFWSQLFVTPANITALLGGVLAITLGFASGALAARRQAILRLHGRRYVDSLVPAAGRIAARWLAVGGVTVLVLAPALWWYNDFGQLSRFAFAGVLLATGGLALLVVSHALGIAVARRPELGAALKGGPGGDRWGYALVYATRALAVLVALQFATEAVATERHVQLRNPRQERWRGFADFAQMSGASTPDDLSQRKDSRRLGAWMRTEWEAGRAPFVQRMPAKSSPRLTDLGDTEIVDVNQAYLNLNPLRDAAGRAISARDGAIKVYVPAVARGHERVIAGEAKTLAAFQESLKQKYDGERAPVPRVHVGHLAANATVFTPSTVDGSEQQTLTVDDPILVVWPTTVDYLALSQFPSWSSAGSLSFAGLERVRGELTRRDLLDTVGTLESIGQFNERTFQTERAKSYVYAVGLVFLLIIVLVGAVAVAATHLARHQQRSFVLYMAGWSLVERYWKFFVVDAAVVVAIAVWQAHRADQTAAALANMMPGTDPALLSGWTAVGSVAVLALSQWACLALMSSNVARHGREG